MSDSARVTSIEAVKEWREAVCVFRADALEALCAVEMEIRRTFDWVEQQLKFWQGEVRRREELVVQARNELVRRKMMPIIGRTPDTTEQEKALRKAQDRLRQAEEKVAAAKRVMPKLRRAVEEYEGPARCLGNVLDGDLPRAVAMLDRKLDALDAYVNMTAPRPIAPEPPPAAEPKTE